MDKININGLTQGCTAEQLNAIAQNILNRKGDVDMSSCNVTITPQSGMDADMAGIIVKCASTQNGTVNISGATEIDDETWEGIEEYDLLAYMVKAYIKFKIPFAELIKETIYKGLPTYNDTANGNATLYKYNGNLSSLPSSDWYDKLYSYYNDWGNCTTGKDLSGFNYGLFQKYFIPSSMPTKFRAKADDYMTVYINGVQVLKTGIVDTTYTIDWSKYIKLNEVNSICVCGDNTGGAYGCAYFGFVD